MCVCAWNKEEEDEDEALQRVGESAVNKINDIIVVVLLYESTASAAASNSTSTIRELCNKQ